MAGSASFTQNSEIYRAVLHPRSTSTFSELTAHSMAHKLLSLQPSTRPDYCLVTSTEMDRRTLRRFRELLRVSPTVLWFISAKAYFNFRPLPVSVFQLVLAIFSLRALRILLHST